MYFMAGITLGNSTGRALSLPGERVRCDDGTGQSGGGEQAMNLQHLVAFCRVVDLGSFTRAAEELNLSQPAVTKQVKALEKELGSPLLERRGRQLRLTREGEVVYPY